VRLVWRRPRRQRCGPRGIGICGIDTPCFDVYFVVRLFHDSDVHHDVVHDDIYVIDVDDTCGAAFELDRSEHSFLQNS
jgi:hypothetical protein